MDLRAGAVPLECSVLTVNLDVRVTSDIGETTQATSSDIKWAGQVCHVSVVMRCMHCVW